MSKVLIMQGIPGSGKSTFVRENYPAAQVCSADAFFMVHGKYVFEEAKLKEAHRQCLRDFITAIVVSSNYAGNLALPRPSTVIIVDNTNVQRWEMTAYVQIALAYGYEVEIHTFMVDPKTAFERNAHNVKWETILRGVLCMEPPIAAWGRHIVHLPDGGEISGHLDDSEPKNPFSLVFVVNGDNIEVVTPPEELLGRARFFALEAAGRLMHHDLTKWEIRTLAGAVLDPNRKIRDYGLESGQKLLLLFEPTPGYLAR